MKILILENDYEIIYDKYKENIGPLAGIHKAISYCINLKGDSDYSSNCTRS